MAIAELTITDGTTRIPLLSASSGFYLDDWKPATAEPKGGGIWQESPFVDGRRLAMKQYGNITDTFSVGIQGASADDCIWWAQEMRRLLRKASEYWTTDWQNEPVWIEAIGECEGEGDVSTTHPHVLDLDSLHKRYALIMDGRFPSDDNPYKMPMVGSSVGEYAMTDLVLSIEHQYWTAQEPMTADCVQVRNHHRYPWVMSISPNATDFRSANAAFDNLPAGNFTAEIWINGSISRPGYLFEKDGVNGWYARVDAAGTITCFANFPAAGDATLTTGVVIAATVGWTHIAITFTGAGAKNFAVWVNGVAAGGAPVAGIGAYVGDAAADFFVASNAGANELFPSFLGKMAWTRISNSVRWAAPFVSPVYTKLPDYDAATVCITNGFSTWAGGNIAWTNSFAHEYNRDYPNNYTWGSFYDEILAPINYLENQTTLACDSAVNFSANCDREGCGLDYAFWEDVGGAPQYGPNVIDNNPSNLLPAAPAVGDMFYFGAGYFQGSIIPSAVVFEFAPGVVRSGFTLEYYSSFGPGWVAVPLYYSVWTNNVLSIQSEPPPLAIPFLVNGYYAYWYRMVFTTVNQGSIVSGPALISSPAIEVLSTQIVGDVGAIVRLGHDAVMDQHDATATDTKPQRFLYTLFSQNREDERAAENWFTPFINLATTTGMITTKPRNQPGIRVDTLIVAGGAGGLVFDSNAPGLWCSQLTGLATTGYTIVEISRPNSLTYTGKFRIFLRAKALTGAKGNVTVALYQRSPAYGQIGQTQQIPITPELIEFGVANFPAVSDGRWSDLDLFLYFTVTTAGPYNVNLYDLILWPVDEWVCETEWNPTVSPVPIKYTYMAHQYTILDPVTSPKHTRSTIEGYIDIDNAVFPYNISADMSYPVGMRSSMSDNYPKMHSNSNQKLFMLQAFPYNSTTWYWPTFYVRDLAVEKREQYESMRGNR